MPKSVQGVYRDGRIELLEPAPEDAAGPIVVTFLAASGVDLAERGIDQQQAADLRRRLATFTEDWQQPVMDDYDVL
jgi:hypothetical protein